MIFMIYTHPVPSPVVSIMEEPLDEIPRRQMVVIVQNWRNLSQDYIF
jgi:hypothetical protein